MMTYIKKDRPEGGASGWPGPQTYEKTENDRKNIVAQFPSFRKLNLEGGEGASPMTWELFFTIVGIGCCTSGLFRVIDRIEGVRK